MMNHPFVSDLSSKTLDELTDTISKLNKQLQYMYRIGKTDMVSQISMAINSYKSEYAKRQQEMWDKKTPHNMDKKIDIS
jgi:hypothetical protein